MKIFLTGGTGFIGSHFINEAHNDGHEIVALKRESSQPRIAISKDPAWITGQLDKNLTREFDGCDVLVHFAAHSANEPYDTLENCLHWNLTASIKLIRQAIASGIKKFLIAGSCVEYGQSGERFDFIPTDAPLEPTSSYSTSKAAATLALRQLCIESNLQLQILRIFQVFGAGENKNRLWPSLRKAAMAGKDFPMTEGEQIRDFVPVSTVAKKFIDALSFTDVRPGQPEISNVGSGNPQTILNFSEFWWKKWKAKGKLLPGALPYRDNEVMRFVPYL